MNATTIEKLVELKRVLAKAANAWRANYGIDVVADLILQEKDTSSAQEVNYIAGTVTQVIRPKLMVIYRIYQDEHTEYNLISMPPVPYTKLECDAMDIDFHITALYRILIDTAPSAADWTAAEEAYQEKMKHFSDKSLPY